MKTFSDSLRAEKARLGITHREMAEIVNVPSRTWFGWVSGDHVPTAEISDAALAVFRAIEREACVHVPSQGRKGRGHDEQGFYALCRYCGAKLRAETKETK